MASKHLMNFVQGKSIDEIIDILKRSPYHVSVKVKEDLALFKYSDVGNLDDPLVQECRGMILQIHPNNVYTVAAKPFPKFFNYHEKQAAIIDWSTAVIEEKIDGSFLKYYYHNGLWRWASMGCIDAKDAQINETSSLQDLIEDVLKENPVYRKVLETCKPGYTYLFELVHPENRIVVIYEKSDLF